LEHPLRRKEAIALSTRKNQVADNGVDLNIQLRYVGDRYTGGRLPLDVLADLPAFRDLLFAYAKEVWRGYNTERQRVPKGFDKSFAFDLVAIEDGSAKPKLMWDKQAAQAYLPGFADELQTIVDHSYVHVLRLVEDAANGVFPKALASEHVRALNKFGSGLRDGERIEFVGSNDKQGNVVYLDGPRRKSLITKVRETYESRYEDVGTLVGTYAADDPSGKLTVRTQVHGDIELSLDKERIVQEFDGNIGCLVQVDLQLELDNADNYRSTVSVREVALIDDRIAADLERCKARLDTLAMMTDGWDDGSGVAVNAAALHAARKFLHRRPLLCSSYKIFPTAAGAILFEFECNGWDLSLEFALGGSVELYGIEVEGKGELLPKHFEGVDEALITEFDKRVGRNGI
jgi:hypothetical protein